MVCSMGPKVWEGLAAQLTHLGLTACPGAYTCGLFPALAVVGKLASLDLHFTGEWFLGPAGKRHIGLPAGDLACGCMAAAGVPSLQAVSLRLTGLWGAGSPRGEARCSLTSASNRQGQGLLPGTWCGDCTVRRTAASFHRSLQIDHPRDASGPVKLVSSGSPLLAGVPPCSSLRPVYIH